MNGEIKSLPGFLSDERANKVGTPNHVFDIAGSIFICGLITKDRRLVYVMRRWDNQQLWSDLAPIPTGETTYGAVFVANGSRIYMFSMLPSEKVRIYDTITDTWSYGPIIPDIYPSVAISQRDSILIISHELELWRWNITTGLLTRLKDFPAGYLNDNTAVKIDDDTVLFVWNQQHGVNMHIVRQHYLSGNEWHYATWQSSPDGKDIVSYDAVTRDLYYSGKNRNLYARRLNEDYTLATDKRLITRE